MRNCKNSLVLAALALTCFVSGPGPSPVGSARAESFYTAFEEITYNVPDGFIAQAGLENSPRLSALQEQMEPDFKVTELLVNAANPGYIVFIGYAARDLFLPQSPEQFANRMFGLQGFLSRSWLDAHGLFSQERAQSGVPAVAGQGFLLLDQPERMAFSLYVADDSGLLASTACHVFCNGIVVEINIQRSLSAAGAFPDFARDSLDLLRQLDLRLVE